MNKAASLKFSSISFDWRTFFQRYGLLIALAILWLYFEYRVSGFISKDNFITIVRQSSVNGIVAIGMMMVILTRGIDLSVGSVLALAAVIGTDYFKNEHWSAEEAIGLFILVGAVLGLVNGILVGWIKIPPFIATLGMMTLARGAARYYTGGEPISRLGPIGKGFRYLGSGEYHGIPVPILVAGVVYLIAYIVLEHTVLGRHVFAAGDNEQAARLSGLPVRTLITGVYALGGALTALAGVVVVGRLGSAQPTMGAGYEFDAITAVVVGGTSFDGGEGTVFGTLIGVLIIGTLDSGLNQLHVAAAYQDISKGAVIALALLLHRAIR